MTNNTVVFEFKGYVETVIMHTANNAVCIIECKEDESIVAYRIEAQDTSVHNYLAVTFEDACNVYADALIEVDTTLAMMRDELSHVASYCERFSSARQALLAAEYAEIVAKEQQVAAFLHYAALESALNASNSATISAKIV